MNLLLEVPTLSHELFCNCCDQSISTGDIIHLRDHCALPEEPTFHVHEYCLETFIEEHPGCWRKIAPDSVEAGWLLY